MSELFNQAPKSIDLTDPKGPMGLQDWVALYPRLPLRTISLCLWEASHAAQSHGSDEDRNSAVTWLVAERLEELRCAPSQS
jgi:hypothetical protein